MTNPMSNHVRPGLVALLVAFLAAVPLAGCKSLDAMFDPQGQAMALLSESVKGQVNGYLKDVEDASAILRQVTDLQSALAKAPELAPFAGRIQDAYRGLQALDAETLKNVRTAFGPQLRAASKGFTGELGRIGDMGSAGAVIKPLLEKVPLFS